jgi:hypothetical protein
MRPSALFSPAKRTVGSAGYFPRLSMYAMLLSRPALPNSLDALKTSTPIPRIWFATVISYAKASVTRT